MPKQTFFNLPEDKRKQLLAVAMEEFASNDFNSASVSRIVEKLGIAKGSIYQYFDDKQEMFLYLVEDASRQLLTQLQAGTPPSGTLDFFQDLRQQMSATVRVNLANPLLSQLLRRSIQAPAPLRDELGRRLAAISGNYLLQMIVAGVERGEVKSRFDPMLINLVLSGLFGELNRYIAARLNLDLEQAATIDLAIFDSPIVEQIYDDVIDILRNGLAQ